MTNVVQLPDRSLFAEFDHYDEAYNIKTSKAVFQVFIYKLPDGRMVEEIACIDSLLPGEGWTFHEDGIYRRWRKPGPTPYERMIAKEYPR